MNTKINILGIDTGTRNTGCSVLTGDLASQTVYLSDFCIIRTTKKDGSVRERIDQITNKIAAYVERGNIDYIVIEDFTEQGVRTGTIHKEMSWLTEAIRSLGMRLNCKTIVYENKEWKKKTLKIYRATKKQVQHYVHWKFPEAKKKLKGQPDHIFDSIAIGHALWLELLSNNNKTPTLN